MNLFIQRICDKILEAKDANNSKLSDVRSVYYGNPINFPEQNLPAIFVEPVSVDVGNNMEYNRDTYIVNVGVVVSDRDQYGIVDSSPTYKIVKTKQRIIDMTQGLNTQNQLDVTTIYGIIVQNSCAIYDNKTVASNIRVTNIDYGEVNLPFTSYRSLITIEAQATTDYLF